MALALKRIGRQVDPARTVAGQHALPVDADAGDLGRREERRERLALVAARAQRRHQGRPLVRIRPQAVGRHPGQRPVGPQLQEAPHAGGVEGRHRRGEAHRLADVPDPELRRGDHFRSDQIAGEAGDDRDPRRGERQPLGDVAQRIEHRVDERRVEGVADAQPLGLAPAVIPERLQHVERVDVARHHDGPGPVDGGNHQPSIKRGQRRGGLVLGRLDGEHAAAVRQRAEQRATCRHQGGGVGQGEHARDVRGRQLADRMPHQHVRPDPERLDEREQRDLDGEQRGLRVLGPVQERRLRGARRGGQQLGQRAVEVAVELLADRIQRVAEDRERRRQPLAHAGTLSALAGEQERRLAVARRAGDRARRPLAALDGAERFEQRLAVGADHGGAALESRAAGGERQRHVLGPVRGPVAEMGAQLPRLRAQRGLRPGRQQPRDRRRLARVGVGVGVRRGRGGRRGRRAPPRRSGGRWCR